MAVDPKEAAERVREKVVKGLMRRYYRVGRTGRFYGGIATADCCGCNLACIFCWSNYPREHPEIGRFYQPEEIGRILIQKAKKKGYHQVRISGNEPTLAKDHLMRVIEIVNRSGLIFILETNGTLIDSDFAKDLRDFSHLHVRVSLKGANEEDFARLTQSDRVGFQLQLDGLSHLIS
ncbi:molybdenum cofactor biosynthesis protein MoaA, partial [candidate division WOR-3 bacterium]